MRSKILLLLFDVYYALDNLIVIIRFWFSWKFKFVFFAHFHYALDSLIIAIQWLFYLFDIRRLKRGRKREGV